MCTNDLANGKDHLSFLIPSVISTTTFHQPHSPLFLYSLGHLHHYLSPNLLTSFFNPVKELGGVERFPSEPS
jgi:hypothetical protein